MQNNCIIKSTLPLGHNMAMVAKTYFAAFSKLMEEHELDRFFTILCIIHQSPKKTTQQNLANALKMDKVSMVRVLDVLSEKGFIIRRITKTDRRAKHIELTEKAKKQMAKLEENINWLNEKALAGINEKDKTILLENLKHINNNLNILPGHMVSMSVRKSKR